MGLWEIVLIAFGLSMDAFAVSVCKGLSARKVNLKQAGITGLYFGGFQAIMPLIGFLIGYRFKNLITNFDHWVAFILLVIIGFNMIKESRSCDARLSADFRFKTMFPLAIATSIDALAVGVTFAFLQVNIVQAVSFIGIITFLVSAFGIKLGNKLGDKFKTTAEITGGVILILIGIKILLEHMGIIG